MPKGIAGSDIKVTIPPAQNTALLSVLVEWNKRFEPLI